MPPHEQHPPISQRDLLRAGVRVVGGGALFLALRSLGMYVPGPEPEEAVRAFEPGWLEKRHPQRPPFIEATRVGHKRYLRYLCLNDKDLKTDLSSAFRDLTRRKQRTPSLADMVARHIGYAADVLSGRGARVQDAVHMSFFSLAAVLSNYFSNREVRDYFGAPISVETGHEGRMFDIGDFKANLPTIFAGDGGMDVLYHFAQSAFLEHELWYANEYGLTEAYRIPNAARFLGSFGGSAEGKADIVANLSQYVWKYYETKTWIGQMWDEGTWVPPTTGYFGPADDRKQDFRANQLGIQYAESMNREVLDVSQVRDSVRALNTPEAIIGPKNPQPTDLPLLYP